MVDYAFYDFFSFSILSIAARRPIGFDRGGEGDVFKFKHFYFPLSAQLRFL
jgi:hypothetical protein